MVFSELSRLSNSDCQVIPQNPHAKPPLYSDGEFWSLRKIKLLKPLEIKDFDLKNKTALRSL